MRAFRQIQMRKRCIHNNSNINNEAIVIMKLTSLRSSYIIIYNAKHLIIYLSVIQDAHKGTSAVLAKLTFYMSYTSWTEISNLAC